MSHQANLLQLIRRIPSKWVLVIAGLVLLYGLGQPLLNRTFGWSLPTVADWLRQAELPPSSATVDERPELSHRPEPPARSEPLPTAEITEPSDTNASPSGDFLSEIAPDRYRSPAGLVYTRGSQEGHRLKHLARHLQDQPTRPGLHGVFDGDLTQALKWIDEAFVKAMQGERNARTRQDGQSTIYEFTFDRPIGFVGGRDGKRQGNPPTRRLRIVVIGQNVITAFPY